MRSFRLRSHLGSLRARGEKALVLFVTAGDPDLASLPEIVAALEAGGADAIEIGIPFSDPFGEGPTIQASSQRALEAGVSPGAILDAISRCRSGVPLLTMGYVNPVLRMGFGEFARRSVAAGVSGTILSDLVPDEAGAWTLASEAAGLDTVFLAAPTSTDERLDEVARRSSGFVYAVSRTGVTGAESAVSDEAEGLVARIRARTEAPVIVGFGVSRPEHVARVCAFADGAVVGSALVAHLAKGWGRDERARTIEMVRALKEATRG